MSHLLKSPQNYTLFSLEKVGHRALQTEHPRQPNNAAEARDEESFQVEVAPLQSVYIGDDQIFIFRRIMINQKIFRQGFILKIDKKWANTNCSTTPLVWIRESEWLF